MNPALSVVSDNDPPPARRETVVQRVRRLQAEAKGAARDHVRQLEQKLAEAQRLAAEISGGGEVYPVGVRNVARLLVDECESRILTLQAIAARQR